MSEGRITWVIEEDVPNTDKHRTLNDKNVCQNRPTPVLYYYWYSALGPVWVETRVQSGDWYGSGTLHPGQVLRGSLPLLSPAFYMFPLFTTRCLHVCHDVRDPSCGSERSQRQKW